jgi:hypothetical protein
MKVVIFEVCRSPEIRKDREALILSNFFIEQSIDYEVYSNDGIWLDRKVLNKELLVHYLKHSGAGIVHLAMHGNDDGLVLKWSESENIRNRVVEDLLTSFDIKTTCEWRGKLVVSGACSSAKLAKFFLDAGATGVIAPETPIPWLNLGRFFQIFYKALFTGQQPREALALAISQFPEYKSYQLYSI